MTAKTFNELEVWQHAHALVLDVYRLTESFPKHEVFGLTSQVRRAAVSVPANIAEGFRKKGVADKLRFYNIARVRSKSATTILSLPPIWVTAPPKTCCANTTALLASSTRIAKPITASANP